MIRSFGHVILLVLALALTGCERSAAPGGNVVLYSSIDDTYARLACREFEAATGIHVDLVTDSEAAKSTGLVQRLIAEKAQPVADVFWSGDPMRAHKLETAGLGKIASIGPTRVRLIVFNTNLVSPDAVPKQVTHLARPEFAKKACMANPLFGTTSMHAATLLRLLGEVGTQQFFNDFAAHGGRMLASNGEVKRRVGNGEFAFGLTDSDDVAVGLGEGKPIGFIVPDQMDGETGAVSVPAVTMMITGCPNKDLSAKLAEWLGGDKMQQLLAQSDAEFLPTSPSVQVPLAHLHLERMKIKFAPAMTAELAARFEAWEHSFLESWVVKQLQ